MIFFIRLENLCKTNKITITKLCNTIGLSNAIATKWKNGAIPNGKILSDIADYFNCSIDYLMGRTDNPEINR